MSVFEVQLRVCLSSYISVKLVDLAHFPGLVKMRDDWVYTLSAWCHFCHLVNVGSVIFTPSHLSQLYAMAKYEAIYTQHRNDSLTFAVSSAALPLIMTRVSFCCRWCNKTNLFTNTAHYHNLPLLLSLIDELPLSSWPISASPFLPYSHLMLFIFLNLLYLLFDRCAHSPSSTN